MPPAELGDDVRWIITNGRDSDTFSAELIYPALQLDQLRLAIRSPVGGAVEHQHCALRTHYGIPCPGLAILVFQIEIWHSLTDLRAELRQVHWSSSPLQERKKQTAAKNGDGYHA